LRSASISSKSGGLTNAVPRVGDVAALHHLFWPLVRSGSKKGADFMTGGDRCSPNRPSGLAAGISATGQGTKSLRDSPLRGGLPARAVTKGEIVDSGRRALS
jgi:hypothetical protein